MSLRLLVVLSLLATFSVNAAELAKKECPTDSTLRAKALRKEGTVGNLSWLTLAVPLSIGSDQYCYERSVSVAKPTFVHWPLAGMTKLYVKDAFTTANCCWPGARTERGSLEYGARRQTVATEVYRGQGEPGGDTSWAAAYGSLTMNGEVIPIDVSATAALPGAASCSQEVRNDGEDIVAATMRKTASRATVVRTGDTKLLTEAPGALEVSPSRKRDSKFALLLPSCRSSSWPTILNR